MNKTDKSPGSLWVRSNLTVIVVLFAFCCAFCCAFCLVMGVSCGCERCLWERPEKWKKLKLEMKKEEVKNILGEPLKICIRKEDERATHCKYNGYPASFAIADEAFVYEHKGTKNTVVYIYFGKSGRVSGWQYLGK